MSKARGLVEELIQIYPDNDFLYEFLKKVEKEELYTRKFELTGEDIDKIKIQAKLEVPNEILHTICAYGKPVVREKIESLERALGEINV